jgi:hypothetical protein
MDLNQMPWGPFDALGQHLSLLLPSSPETRPGGPEVESEIARALRHVEHAADRCGEFARASDDNRELWLSSQRTWEWIRRYLTRLWVKEQVEGDTRELLGTGHQEPEVPEKERGSPHPPLPAPPPDLPSMPGAAATLKAAAKALRTTSLPAWQETVGREDPEAPTREEAIQTLLGVAKLLDAHSRGADVVVEMDAPARGGATSTEPEAEASPFEERSPREELDFEAVSIDFAEGYDQGYRMGRKVGWALGSRRRRDPKKSGESVGKK